MAALDTNILVRFIVQDEPRQAAAASRLIEACVRQGESLFVPATVLLEFEWVLRSVFGFDKEQVTATLSRLLSSVELRFESEGAIEIALASYKDGAADFSDCVHVALAHAAGESPLWTFDRAASRVPGASLLNS